MVAVTLSMQGHPLVDVAPLLASAGGTVTLEGDWRSERQYVELRKGNGKIVLPFTAGEVNLVMQPGPSGSPAVTVLLDGKSVDDVRGADAGADGVARLNGPGMIRLVAGASRQRHVLTLVTSDPGGAGVRVHFRTLGQAVDRAGAASQHHAQ